MVAAIYPGTFDPLTYGHMDIIEREAALFGKLVVGIYENASKQPLFPLEQRGELLREAVTGLPNVHVKAFQRTDRGFHTPDRREGHDPRAES